MNETDIAHIYRNYIACLNAQDWPNLGRFVHENARHNGRLLGVSGYWQMLVKDYSDIPDLHFEIDLLVSQPPFIASRLLFRCSPKGEFLGLPINGRTVSFTENVFYRFQSSKIEEVWSVLDKSAIEAQL